MAKRRTKIVLEIEWDDESSVDHPSAWPWDMLRFGSVPADGIKLLDFEDFDDQEMLIA